MGYSYNNFFMSLSGNSHTSISSGLVSIHFPLTMGHIFLLLCMIGNFLFDPRHCEFYFLDAGYFCIPVNILKGCSGIKLHYLETV